MADVEYVSNCDFFGKNQDGLNLRLTVSIERRGGCRYVLDGPGISLTKEEDCFLVDLRGYVDGWDEESAAS